MKYEKATVEIIVFDDNTGFMAQSGNHDPDDCNNYEYFAEYNGPSYYCYSVYEGGAITSIGSRWAICHDITTNEGMQLAGIIEIKCLGYRI